MRRGREQRKQWGKNMWSTESELRLCIDDFLEANWYEYPTPARCGVSRKTLKRFEEGNVHNMKYSTVYKIFHNVGWTDGQIQLLSPEKNWRIILLQQFQHLLINMFIMQKTV